MGTAHEFVANHEDVIRKFGCWPAFHDAEVEWVELRREEASLRLSLTVPWFGANHGVVLRFTGIEMMELFDFNNQNALFEMRLEPLESGFRVTLHASYGLAGSFTCRAAAVEQE